jgi:hypothetical protein
LKVLINIGAKTNYIYHYKILKINFIVFFYIFINFVILENNHIYFYINYFVIISIINIFDKKYKTVIKFVFCNFNIININIIFDYFAIIKI